MNVCDSFVHNLTKTENNPDVSELVDERLLFRMPVQGGVYSAVKSQEVILS